MLGPEPFTQADLTNWFWRIFCNISTFSIKLLMMSLVIGYNLVWIKFLYAPWEAGRFVVVFAVRRRKKQFVIKLFFGEHSLISHVKCEKKVWRKRKKNEMNIVANMFAFIVFFQCRDAISAVPLIISKIFFCFYSVSVLLLASPTWCTHVQILPVCLLICFCCFRVDTFLHKAHQNIQKMWRCSMAAEKLFCHLNNVIFVLQNWIRFVLGECNSICSFFSEHFFPALHAFRQNYSDFDNRVRPCMNFSLHFSSALLYAQHCFFFFLSPMMTMMETHE